ncbi:MAG: CinA family protein [Pirellulaceae bacterium]|nr:CinA family protein [Pirellulaceae bacterium]
MTKELPNFVARLLKQAGQKVVFAESCTGGLVSGELTKVPGISEHHCGGVVTYRNATKAEYLGIPGKMLLDPGPVSREVAEQMARRVLAKTPEATVAVSVTGHLGPHAPPELNGLVFIGIARRVGRRCDVAVTELHCPRRAGRVARQRWVVQQALEILAEALAR